MVWLLASVGALAVLVLVGSAVVFLVLKKRPKPAVDADFERDFGERGLGDRAAPPVVEREAPAPAAPVVPAASPTVVPEEPETATSAVAAEEAAAFGIGEAAAAAPVEAPPPAEVAPLAPAAPPTGGPEQVEKLRIADLGLVLFAYAIRLGGEDLLAFSSEGFASRGREELVLYVRRSACPDDAVVRALKRFAALSVVVLERQEPVRVGELLKVPGEIGNVPLGGYLAFEANEPEPVPFGPHLVLVGVPRRRMTQDPAALRASLVGAGGAPYLTALERTEA